MTFLTAADARRFCRETDRTIYVRIAGEGGIFQFYPGGRIIRWPETERYQRRLTTLEDLQHKEFGGPQ